MERFREPSTWIGLVTLGALALGYVLAPEQIAAIATSLSALAGAVLIGIQEK